jgi:tetratricopeptide (TPR) repeat protein
MRRLGASDPGNAGWQNDIALINQDLAIVLAERGQIGEALESHREGLAILRRLAASDPGNPQLQNKLAISLLAGAHLKRMQGDVASARADYAQALAILRNLVAQYPQDATWRSQLDTAESVLNLDKGAP